MRITPLIHRLWIVFFSVLIFAVHGATSKAPKRFYVTVYNENFEELKVFHFSISQRIAPMVAGFFKLPSKGMLYAIDWNAEITKKEDVLDVTSTSNYKPMVYFAVEDLGAIQDPNGLCKRHNPCFGWTQTENSYRFGSILSLVSATTDEHGHQTVTWGRYRLDPLASSRWDRSETLTQGDRFNTAFRRTFENFGINKRSTVNIQVVGTLVIEKATKESSKLGSKRKKGSGDEEHRVTKKPKVTEKSDKKTMKGSSSNQDGKDLNHQSGKPSSSSAKQTAMITIDPQLLPTQKDTHYHGPGKPSPPPLSKKARFVVTVLTEQFVQVTEIKMGTSRRIKRMLVDFLKLPPGRGHIHWEPGHGLGEEVVDVSNGIENKPMVHFAVKDRGGTQDPEGLCKNHPCFGWVQKDPVSTFGSIFSLLSTSTGKDGHRTATWLRHRLDPRESDVVQAADDKFVKTFKSSQLNEGITVIIKESNEDPKELARSGRNGKGKTKTSRINGGAGNKKTVKGSKEHDVKITAIPASPIFLGISPNKQSQKPQTGKTSPSAENNVDPFNGDDWIDAWPDLNGGLNDPTTRGYHWW